MYKHSNDNIEFSYKSKAKPFNTVESLSDSDSLLSYDSDVKYNRNRPNEYHKFNIEYYDGSVDPN